MCVVLSAHEADVVCEKRCNFKPIPLSSPSESFIAKLGEKRSFVVAVIS